jgi:DNA-binding transcriptional regulator YbjK
MSDKTPYTPPRVWTQDEVSGGRFAGINRPEAGATHGAVKYYFGSRDALMKQALHEVAGRNIDALRELQPQLRAQAHDPAAFAATLARQAYRQMLADRDMGIAIQELHLTASRRPALRPLIREWGRAYLAASEEALRALGSRDPRRDTALLVSVINGLVLQQLSVPRDDFEDAVLRPTLERILAWIVV